MEEGGGTLANIQVIHVSKLQTAALSSWKPLPNSNLSFQEKQDSAAIVVETPTLQGWS